MSPCYTGIRSRTRYAVTQQRTYSVSTTGISSHLEAYDERRFCLLAHTRTFAPLLATAVLPKRDRIASEPVVRRVHRDHGAHAPVAGSGAGRTARAGRGKVRGRVKFRDERPRCGERTAVGDSGDAPTRDAGTRRDPGACSSITPPQRPRAETRRRNRRVRWTLTRATNGAGAHHLIHS